jgi:hypothetical protein
MYAIFYKSGIWDFVQDWSRNLATLVKTFQD